jgi:1-acyl-sn-glycerol-3-phosphate acyltransferase
MEFIKRILLEVFRWPIVNVWYLTGWSVSQEKIDEPRLVITGAPHTSNWDYFMFLLAILHLRRRPFVTAKDSLFKPPIGFFIRFFGGIPIDRSKSNNLVQQMRERINSREKIWIVFSPDGTRSYRPYWKTGFYWVAIEADVPIACAAINYKTRIITIDLIFKPSGDIEADMAMIREYQEKYGSGLYPKKENPVVLRPKEPEETLVEVAS